MKVGLYARVSSEAQDVSLSISAQLKALREYADRNGYLVIREFVDEAETGRSISKRPAFREMVSLARSPKKPLDAILIWKFSRFARNRADSIVYKTLLRKHGVQVISITEPADNSPTGRLMEAIIESVELVNEEMDDAASSYRDEMDTLLNEIGSVDRQLDNLYGAIENGNIDYELLKPRLQERKTQHDKLLARKAELEMVLSQRKIELASPEVVRKYVQDLRQFLDSSDLPERKAFIKRFVKEVRVTGVEARIRYTFPIPPDNLEEENLGVLSIVRYGGR